MPIPLPNLDDRRWAELVEQGRALIPLYSPEWTDHNASDPGITLMELLAFIAEMDVYRLNRIPDRHKRRILDLMGIRPAPPRPSRAVVELQIPADVDPVGLPTSIEYSATGLDGAPTAFQSTAPVTVVSARLRAVQRRDATGFQNLTPVWTRQEALALFGDDPATGFELYLGFDAPLPRDRWITLYFGFAGERTGWDERQRILEDRATGELPPHHSVRIVWEYLAAGGGSPRWLRLESADGTRSFTLDGSVGLLAAQDMAAQAVGTVPPALYYIRCRFDSGAYDAVPRAERILTNAVEVVQAAPVWQSLPIARGAAASGSAAPGDAVSVRLEWRNGAIQSLALGPPQTGEPSFTVLAYVPATTSASGSLTLEAIVAGTGTGEPNQTLLLPRHPLVEASLRLHGLEGSTWREWERVDDFAASSRSAAHYLLNPTGGDITFGDGEHGRTAPPGSLLFAVYDATAGNADPARVTRIADSPHNRAFVTDSGAGAVTVGGQVSPQGGAAAETLAHAIGRAMDLREARLRAVTVEDFEAIAVETPGTRVARATAWPNLYPGLDCVRAPGVVTVVVVPAMPGPRPTPSPGLLREVAARLERRRAIGTRVMVVGPRYLEVAVRARVRAFDGVGKARLRGEVAAAIDRFLQPLTGGPDGTGWPFGRDVFRSEVLQVIDETAGVDHVLSLELIPEGCAPSCGNLCLRPTWLVAAGQHEIEVV